MIDLRTLKTLDSLADLVKQITAPKTEFNKRLKELKGIAEKIDSDRVTAENAAKESAETLAKNETVLAKIQRKETTLSNKAIKLEKDASDLKAARDLADEKIAAAETRHIETVKAEREFAHAKRAQDDHLAKENARLKKWEEELQARDAELQAKATRVQQAMQA